MKHNYLVRVVSSNISLDKFYLKKDELTVINKLITLSNSKKKQPTIFIWPEGIISESYIRDMKIYEDLFLNNFSEDDIIIMGIKSIDYKIEDTLVWMYDNETRDFS